MSEIVTVILRGNVDSCIHKFTSVARFIGDSSTFGGLNVCTIVGSSTWVGIVALNATVYRPLRNGNVAALAGHIIRILIDTTGHGGRLRFAIIVGTVIDAHLSCRFADSRRET